MGDHGRMADEQEERTMSSNEVRYPDVEVTLSGEDGNAYMILGLVKSALRRAGVGEEEVALFNEQATADDYDHLLQTAMRWVSVA